MASNDKPGSTPEKLYNLSNIRQIGGTDTAFVQKMIRMFADRIPSAMLQVWEAYSSGDFKTVRDVVHTLRPGVDNMGITSLKVIMKETEKLALENPSSPALKENITKIEAVLMQVFEQLKEELN